MELAKLFLIYESYIWLLFIKMNIKNIYPEL